MARLRILIRMESADAYELKAQALNKDPRLASAGISALKFTGDKKYIADGEFSLDPPPPAGPPVASAKPESDVMIGKRLRVVVRMVNADGYELKAQALNKDPRLEDAGIAALKFVGDKQYIIGGEFSPDLPSPPSKPDFPTDKKLRVTLRMTRQDAYELIAKHLNGDPELAKAGISGVELAKGAGMVPVAMESPQPSVPTPAPPPTPAPAKKKKRGLRGCLVAGLIVGLIGIVGIIGASALYLLPNFLAPPPAPVATISAIIPVAGASTSTKTPLLATSTHIPPTVAKATSTKTKLPTATFTKLPTATVLSCQAPKQATVVAENLTCRYGPGAVYLYRTGLAKGDVLDVLGRADTAYGTWIYVQTQQNQSRQNTNKIKCWVNSSEKYVDMQGDVACLDSYYPEKAPLILFNTNLFPKPYNVKASRSGDLVEITWVGYDLQPGDKPDQSPRYLVEMWTCQAGQMVFTPYGTDETYAQVQDEAGCAEASHGQVYLAHVDGYIGPSYIPWPP